MDNHYQQLLEDQSKPFLVLPDSSIVNPYDSCYAEYCHSLVPGSFNPLHKGHRFIYDKIASRATLACFEISINRRDKEPLGSQELQRRLSQFEGYAPVLVTNSLQMQAKSGLFAFNPIYHVGIDTAERIIQDHGILGTQGIRGFFFVYDRIMYGLRHSLSQLPIKPRNMARVYVPDEFACESSTLLRNR